MAIWLGEAGCLRLARTPSNRVFETLVPSDVDVSAHRFGLPRGAETLITGDQVWFRRVEADGQLSPNRLEFVAGWPYPDGKWYCNVDAMGGIRLYDAWDKALSGRVADAVRLAAPSSSMRISYEMEAVDRDDCLAQTIRWELDTNRDTADVTSLGEGFRQRLGTTVSGSGTIECFFDLDAEGKGGDESPIYLHRLAVRQQIGANFRGVFMLKREGALPLSEMLDASLQRKELYYAAECVVTSVSTAIVATEPIRSLIEFATTGPIQLLYGYPVSYLRKEQDTDRVMQESGFGILLEVPAT